MINDANNTVHILLIIYGLVDLVRVIMVYWFTFCLNLVGRVMEYFIRIVYLLYIATHNTNKTFHIRLKIILQEEKLFVFFYSHCIILKLEPIQLDGAPNRLLLCCALGMRLIQLVVDYRSDGKFILSGYSVPSFGSFAKTKTHTKVIFMANTR